MAPNTLFGSNDKYPRRDQYIVTGLVRVVAPRGVHVARATCHDNEHTHNTLHGTTEASERGFTTRSVILIVIDDLGLGV